MRDDANDPDATPNEIYWAESWPAGVALAGAIFDGVIPIPAGPEPILELGCGTGLAALAVAFRLKSLAEAGKTNAPKLLIASDIEPRALALVDENARRHGLEGYLRTEVLDWSKPETYAGKHRLILAADALYHPDAGAELGVFVKHALIREPGSMAVMVDADRWSARFFDETARKAGFKVKHDRRIVPFTAGKGPQMEMPCSGPPTDGVISPDRSIDVSFYELTLS